jgi:hypothetical protein
VALPKESYAPGELNGLIANMDPPTVDDVSITANGRRLDTAEAAIAFFDEMRAQRTAKIAGD